ncbi:polyhydroxyalkanoate synthesis repressor PhaR [Rickettsiales bacterium]|nr:polyhydroxyalkanoate synthesis repressor PhaR [Rickettsiales bacterium]
MTNNHNKSSVAIIKKYANRRLYNTQTSCYITLEDLHEMIVRGEIFEVVDAKTDANLTRTVLTQIIFDQEAKGYNILPISFLRNLISFYGNTPNTVLPSYLEAVMETFVRNQDQFQKFTSEGINSLSPANIFESMAQQNAQMFQNAMNMFMGPFAGKNDK